MEVEAQFLAPLAFARAAKVCGADARGRGDDDRASRRGNGSVLLRQATEFHGDGNEPQSFREIHEYREHQDPRDRRRPRPVVLGVAVSAAHRIGTHRRDHDHRRDHRLRRRAWAAAKGDRRDIAGARPGTHRHGCARARGRLVEGLLADDHAVWLRPRAQDRHAAGREQARPDPRRTRRNRYRAVGHQGQGRRIARVATAGRQQS